MAGAEANAAAVTLARSFHDDPLFNFLIPDPLSPRAALTFAAWLPPGRYPRGVWRETQYISRDMRSVVRLGNRFVPGTSRPKRVPTFPGTTASASR